LKDHFGKELAQPPPLDTMSAESWSDAALVRLQETSAQQMGSETRGVLRARCCPVCWICGTADSHRTSTGAGLFGLVDCLSDRTEHEGAMLLRGHSVTVTCPFGSCQGCARLSVACGMSLPFQGQASSRRVALLLAARLKSVSLSWPLTGVSLLRAHLLGTLLFSGTPWAVTATNTVQTQTRVHCGLCAR